MSPHHALLGLASAAGLLFGASLAFADDVSPPPMPRHEAFCQENPQKCEQMKQKRAERREFCQQNPETCEQQRAERKQRRAEFKAQCAADPAKCQERKQQMRERFHERHGAEPKPAE